jgi:NAD(P)-dependent dehydrogenase (short-subunit alcohol dehydrogenase family)
MFTLITGASSGIGRATAVRLSAERALILHGRDRERLEETRLLCTAPERHLLWCMDLNDVSSIAESLKSLLTERPVEAFVHCAGTVTVLPVRSTDHKVAQGMMNVNFFSASEIVNVLLKKKINGQQLANIVLISSIFSGLGARGHSAYCASKGALDGWMRALAVELAPSIRVNSILPGALKTGMSTGAFSDPEIVEKFKRDYPMGIGDPSDIADVVAFLLSSNARWMTGQQITVDGGRTASISLK